MKTTLLFSNAVIFAMSSLTLTAQTTITEANYQRTGTFSHTFGRDQSAVVLPATGSNQSWDYTSLAEETSVTHDHTAVSGDPVFTNANNSSVWYYTFQGMSYSANHYEGLNASAWTVEGRKIFGEGYSITAVTGGADDSLVFLDYDDLYTSPHVQLEFPASFGNTWSSNYERSTPYRLTVVGSGVVNAPGEVREFRSVSSEVVGDGTLFIPLSTGGPAPARDVILVKEIITEIDSVFLNGSPAPTTLLSAFGLVQGTVTVTTSYSFYTPDLSSKLLYILEPVGSLSINRAEYSKDADNLSIDAFSNQMELQVFPNPSNGVFTLDLGERYYNGEVKIFDVSGKMVYHSSFECTQEFQVQFAGIPGVYLLEVSTAEGNQARKKVIKK
ncbi:Por secretion system C-terminal sorting domain-containing protein [Lishizhenia tianjinensis]|uniref:Por secretion system C-terminal sorting domain-containing protein n=1 Tax=Lishizhenia tianjinensis TaxID=477690 RepID=A0A1I7BKZ3_9FLAO|nr:T9SS type A sorting domain-containing protein [Lishizhenia tianjinensis]SFT87849.1 Por secretion system C-terminal sorting domain-containing protein [Lishizhenia tianjinensis]